MPIIGSLDGTFGHGRSPQVAPTPGFTIYPPIGNRSSWIFASNGAFTFDGNVTTSLQFVDSSLPNIWGNTFVITPNTNFFANVKIWGAGGGGGGNTLVNRASVPLGAGGAAINGQILFRGGQPYTFFAGGSGRNHYRISGLGSGGGGAASGIIKGNVFANDFSGFGSENRVAIAGGGGGASSLSPGTDGNPVRLPSAASSSEVTYQRSELYVYSPNPNNIGDVDPGNDTIGYGRVTPKQGMLANIITGTYYYEFTGGDATNDTILGGGGGGNRGGGIESGGTSYVDPDEALEAVSGRFSSPGMSSDPTRGRAGDSGRPGRISFFIDNEFTVSNITATGGTVSEVPIPGYPLAYRYHTFTANGKFTISSVGPKETIDIFAVGGGGGTAGVSGAGGGAVALRTNWPATVGNFMVTVGSGGLASDSYANGRVGRIYGGYRGGDSAFFNNTLSALGFPDNYTRLIYSFNSEIRYISSRGDDSTGLTPATAFTSFESARAKTYAQQSNLLVFVVMSGTYNEQLPYSDIQTPINDDERPRVFVCVPGKVIINFSVGDGRTVTGPMAMLQHPLSAVYGAIFVRTLNEPLNYVNNSAFFFSGYTAIPSSIRMHRGAFYNCVFQEKSTYPWALSYVNPDVANDTWHPEFKVENCTFTNKLSNTTFTSVFRDSSEQRTLFKNCIFAANITTNGVLDDCLESQIVTTKYAVAGVNDKGVFGGEYSWGGTISAIERTARPTMIVARGGGGAPKYNMESRSPELIGGTSPGAIGTVYRTAYLQPSWLANVDFSSYGHPGGSSYYGGGSLASGGGGAGGPGFLAIASNSPGGLGFEWPRRSGIFYGAGGSAAGAFDIGAVDVRYAPNAGAGARGSTPAAGNDGIVMVRYVVAGPLTEPAPPALYNQAIVAVGGDVTQTSTYVQHLYTAAGLFYVYNAPMGSYIDLMIIGGGGGGSGNGHYGVSNPGYPGEVRYYRITNIPRQFNLTITIGAGGRYGTYHEDLEGRSGSATTVSFSGGTFTAAGGGGGLNSNNGGWPGRVYPSIGTLITDGLFSDNTSYYGPTGGGNRTTPPRNPPPNYGTYGSSGNGNFSDGWDDWGAWGAQGAVFIRYSTESYSAPLDE